MKQEYRNIWLSASELDMLATALSAIEIGVFQIRDDLLPKTSAKASWQAIERGCQRLRLVVDALSNLECDP